MAEGLDQYTQSWYKPLKTHFSTNFFDILKVDSTSDIFISQMCSYKTKKKISLHIYFHVSNIFPFYHILCVIKSRRKEPDNC